VDPLVVDIAIAVGSLGLFAAAYGGAMLATRPARPSAGPATQDLGDEPPAVVNLLTNRWRLDEDAAESTLLDLAAKRLIELRQPANDPMHTTIHIRQDEQPPSLQPYEHRVLSRIQGLAVNGVIPVTALTFRNQHHAKSWNKRLHREVVADARARGLSRRRFGPQIVAALTAVAAVSAAGIFLAMLRYVLRNPSEDNDIGGAFVAGVIAFAVLAGIVASQRGERDTPAGRTAAARWLGVRAWLRGHEEFADLPPAAVAVWDRYLPYGAAMGVTHTASAVLDLGMGDRTLVWSSYGDRWRRVRVRYPKLWSRYGQTAPALVWPAVISLVAGGLLVRYRDLPTELDPASDPTVTGYFETATRVALVLGILLLARGGYRAVRALVDLATTRTITGQVLWLDVWRTRSQGENRPRIPWLHYLAVDDGRSDRTTAWALPHATMGPRCRDGDTVTIRVRPWSRRVVALTVVERGRPHQLVDAPAPAEPAAGIGTLGGVVRQLTGQDGPRVGADTLLTAEEVGQALGLPIRAPDSIPGFVGTATYRTADRGRDVLLVQVVSGTPGRWAWQMNQRGGAELPGIGDGAYHTGDRAVLRAGETTVVLTLMRDGKGRHRHVPWLLQQAAARLTPSEPAPAADPPR
jgi:hypothetical protein